MDCIKIFTASKAHVISKFNNLKHGVQKCKANIRLNKQYLSINIPHILESNPHPFYSFRGIKIQMRIRFGVERWILEK